MPWDRQAQDSLNALWAAVASLNRRFDAFDDRLRRLEVVINAVSTEIIAEQAK